MNILGKLFGKKEPQAPVAPAPALTQTHIDGEKLTEHWSQFVDQYVSVYGLPLLVHSSGPGRSTSFATLATLEDCGTGELDRLTDPDVMGELLAEWKDQLRVYPTPRNLVAELQKTEAMTRPSICFLYPEEKSIGKDFSAWANVQAEADAMRDAANKGLDQQGAVVFARLSGSDEMQGWLNEKARQRADQKAQLIVEGIQRLCAAHAAEAVEIGVKTSPKPRNKPSTIAQL